MLDATARRTAVATRTRVDRTTAGKTTSATPSRAAEPTEPTENFITSAARQGAKLVIAHKGHHDLDATPRVKPNTIAALRKAAADGATDAVEADIRSLRDGTLVVYHDEHLADGPHEGELLRDLNASDLRDYPDIPTLDAFAAAAADVHMNVVADIKERGPERRIIDTLLEHLPKERVSAFSFEPSVVKDLDAAYPDIPVGYLPRQYGDSSFKSTRSYLLGSPMEQVDRLGFRPDYIEVSGDDVNLQVLDYAGEHHVPVVVGGTSGAVKQQLAGDHRVLGFMVDSPNSTPTDAEPGSHDLSEVSRGPQYHDVSDVAPGPFGPMVKRATDAALTFWAGNGGYAARRVADDAAAAAKVLVGDNPFVNPFALGRAVTHPATAAADLARDARDLATKTGRLGVDAARGVAHLADSVWP